MNGEVVCLHHLQLVDVDHQQKNAKKQNEGDNILRTELGSPSFLLRMPLKSRNVM
jgi:hypothetical protein